MKFLCIGAGAIGICIGGSLASAGQQVYFWVKPKHQEKLSGRELTIYNGEAVNKTDRFNLVVHPEVLAEIGALDCVLIAVKAFDTDQVIRQLKGMPVPFKAIACLQNGVENEDKLARAFPESEIIGASIVSAVSRLDDTSVRVEKNRGIGICGQGAVCDQLFNSLQSAGLRPKKYSDMQSMKWSKMISNLFSNAVSGILDMTPYEVYTRRGLFRIEKVQILEALAVMRRMGLRVVNLPGLPLKMLVWLIGCLPDFLLQPLLVKLIAEGRGEKMPSFYIEKMKGSDRSEVNYLNGAIVRMGTKYGVSTPVNQTLVEIFNEILSNSKVRDEYSHHPELLERTANVD